MKRIRVALWIDVPSEYDRSEAAADLARLLPEGWCAVSGETADAPWYRTEDEVDSICPSCGFTVPEHGPSCLTRRRPTPEPPAGRVVLESPISCGRCEDPLCQGGLCQAQAR